jgi:hypothetical protein
MALVRVLPREHTTNPLRSRQQADADAKKLAGRLNPLPLANDQTG